jgi:trimeric autotransporter adhesin
MITNSSNRAGKEDEREKKSAGAREIRNMKAPLLGLGQFAILASLGLLAACLLLMSACGSGGGGLAQQTSQAPQLSLGQTSVSFPDTTDGATSSEIATVTLENIGNAMLSITNITDSDIKDFPGNTNCPNPGNLAPGASCTISIQFTPQSTGSLTAQITISSNAGTGIISLSGSGTAASSCAISPEGGSGTFTNTSQQALVVLQNIGQTPVTILDESLSGDFAIFDGQGDPWPACPTTPFTLSPNQSCNFNVQFVPTGSGTFTGTLNIATSCPAQSVITYSYTGQN